MKFEAKTYADLDLVFEEFASGTTALMVLEGRGGTGKTRRLQRYVEEGKCRLINGATITPYDLYHKLFYYRNQPIVIDDIDLIWRNEACVSLLKQVCQTETEKRVAWNSSRLKPPHAIPVKPVHEPMPTEEQLEALVMTEEAGEVPSYFYTSSRIMIITNDWKVRDPNMEALMTRGASVSFEPSGKEVHREARSFCQDDEVYDFIGTYAPYVKVNFRDYVRAAEFNKRNRFPWRESLLYTWGVSEALHFVYRLETDPQWEDKPTPQKIAAFAAKGFAEGSSKSRYYELRAKLDLPPLGIDRLK